MIALLDGITHDIKWYVQGKFSNQHSPRITKKGTLLVFDNYYENKRSRIVEIDIKSKENPVCENICAKFFVLSLN